MYFYFDKLYNPVPTDREYYVVYHQLKQTGDKFEDSRHRVLLGILCVFNDDKKLILPHLIYGNLRNNKTIFKAIKALENKLKEGLQ